MFRRRHKRRFSIIMAVILSICLLLCLYAAMQLKPLICSLATARVSNAVNRAIAEAVSETIDNGGYDYEDLISMEKDNAGRITALTSNMACFNRLQVDVMNNVLKKIGSMSTSDLAVPIGSLTGVTLLAGRGPLVHIKVLAVGTPSAEFENDFTDAGINQTKHQIILNIRVSIRILLPGMAASTSVSNSLSVAETVIVGAVPETYTYFNTNSMEDVQDYITNR